MPKSPRTGAETSPPPSGLSRRELFVDARDLQSDADSENPISPEEYLALLTARGREKLAENQLVKSFSAVVRMQDPTYILGQDYQLGDVITVTDDRLGVTVDAVVEAVERSVSQDGESMVLTLGYGPPTLYEKLKRKAER